MLSETDDQGRPVAYNRVAGVVVTGNEDGAHHVISEISGALADIGYTGVAAVELPRHSHDAPRLARDSRAALMRAWADVTGARSRLRTDTTSTDTTSSEGVLS